jgi:hypothetical protein
MDFQPAQHLTAAQALFLFKLELIESLGTILKTSLLDLRNLFRFCEVAPAANIHTQWQ